jgi:ribosomal protein L39E
MAMQTYRSKLLTDGAVNMSMEGRHWRRPATKA